MYFYLLRPLAPYPLCHGNSARRSKTRRPSSYRDCPKKTAASRRRAVAQHPAAADVQACPFPSRRMKSIACLFQAHAYAKPDPQNPLGGWVGSNSPARREFRRSQIRPRRQFGCNWAARKFLVAPGLNYRQSRILGNSFRVILHERIKGSVLARGLKRTSGKQKARKCIRPLSKILHRLSVQAALRPAIAVSNLEHARGHGSPRFTRPLESNHLVEFSAGVTRASSRTTQCRQWYGMNSAPPLLLLCER